jgi:hypothetical protein
LERILPWAITGNVYLKTISYLFDILLLSC